MAEQQPLADPAFLEELAAPMTESSACSTVQRVSFLNGITSIEQRTKRLWTVQHFNGTRINIPVSAITEDQLDYLRAAGARGRRPEVIQAVIERGRRIERILADDRRRQNTQHDHVCRARCGWRPDGMAGG
jgi:hypothetical protein